MIYQQVHLHMGTEAMFINIVIKNKLLSLKGFSFDREAKLGGLPPAHSSESLKTNSFQIKSASALSNSVACDRVFDIKDDYQPYSGHLLNLLFLV
jgi:hypothetical protein